MEWYKHSDGTIHFGATESTVKTYVEAMRDWYANGWIDEKFQNHNDLFYRTDEQNVVQGKVGLWVRYSSDGYLTESFYSQLSAEDYKTYERTVTLLREEYAKQLPGFIRGETPMSEWGKFTLSLQRLGTDAVTESLNEVLAK